MTTETLMTDQAATTNEGQTASQTTESVATEATGESQTQQATEGQTAEGQQANDGNTDGEQAKPEGAPESYEFKAPEGQQFDDQVIGEFSEVAKELNLPQDAAQKILDKVAPVIHARQVERIEAARAEWADSAKTDKEFGGDKLNENLSVARKALDTFGSPELRALLNESGLGNHPEVIRMMYRAGKAISEDSFVGNGSGGKPAIRNQSDLASSLYPSQQN